MRQQVREHLQAHALQAHMQQHLHVPQHLHRLFELHQQTAAVAISDDMHLSGFYSVLRGVFRCQHYERKRKSVHLVFILRISMDQMLHSQEPI